MIDHSWTISGYVELREILSFPSVNIPITYGLVLL